MSTGEEHKPMTTKSAEETYRAIQTSWVLMPAIFKNCGPTSDVIARGKNMKLNSDVNKVESTGEADIGPEVNI